MVNLSFVCFGVVFMGFFLICTYSQHKYSKLATSPKDRKKHVLFADQKSFKLLRTNV